MTARDDHAARVMAGVSEPTCWAVLFDEVDRMRAEIDQMRWLIDNSTSVNGLRLDGGSLPWHEVIKLYLPGWATPA